MGAYDPVELDWRGKTYSIPPRKVLGAIARVEEHLTFTELLGHAGRNTVATAKLAMAFGSLLRYAGADVTDDDVYEGMFAASVGSSEGADAIVTAISILMSMMIPPGARKNPVLTPGETEASSGNPPVSGENASEPTSRSVSATTGARRKASGG